MSLSSDRIEIRGLLVTTVVGVLPHERTMAQPLRIDLDLFVDLRDAGRTDELTDTANYGTVAERVAEVVRASKDLLLERLADRVAQDGAPHGSCRDGRCDGDEIASTRPRTTREHRGRIRRHRGDYDQPI